MSFFSNKKVLVTGATGFVGTNLVQRLLDEGADIRAIIHKRQPRVLDPRIEYVPCDLTRQEECHSIVNNIDIVFHCAASTSGAAVIEKTPLVHVTPNVVMNAWLMEAAYKAGVKKFVWLGSSTGYPPSGEEAIKEEAMMSGDPYEKYFCVGWMKRFTEVLCRMYAEKVKNPMTMIVLRPTNIYGEYDDFDFATSHVFAALVRRVVERHDPIEVWGTGDDVRDLIYVQDFVDALLVAAENIEQYTALNIGLGQGFSVKQLLDMMLAADGYAQAKIVFDASKPTMIPIRLVDISKAEKDLGFRPQTGIEEGIRKTMHWYRKQLESRD